MIPMYPELCKSCWELWRRKGGAFLSSAVSKQHIVCKQKSCCCWKKVLMVFLVMVCCVCAAMVTADPSVPLFNQYHSTSLFSGHIRRQKSIQALEVSTGDVRKVLPLCCFLVSFHFVSCLFCQGHHADWIFRGLSVLWVGFLLSFRRKTERGCSWGGSTEEHCYFPLMKTIVDCGDLRTSLQYSYHTWYHDATWPGVKQEIDVALKVPMEACLQGISWVWVDRQAVFIGECSDMTTFVNT